MNDYLVKPGSKIDLSKYDPDDLSGYKGDKEAAKREQQMLNQRLEILQEMLYAEHKHRLIVILQAMDTGGKDGVIRNVFEGVNPQGVRVASFKAPTQLELDHDFLWRIHKETPAKGEIVIFNRSHYEDVLVVRVHNLVTEKIWRRRYKHINNFEYLLVEEGTSILKFFLHISYDEQRSRLIKRIDEPEKNWKFNPGDLNERKLWKNYMKAYQEALSRTSTAWAPWYIVPANRKWFRDLVISTILVKHLEKLDMVFPKPVEDLMIYRDQLQSGD